jgi:iron complex transport system substrate-binding protein
VEEVPMRLFSILVIMLLISGISGYVFAALPGDANNDNHLEKSELTEIILDSLENSSQMQGAMDAAWIFTYWNGTPKVITDTSGTIRTLSHPLHRVVVMNSETLETMRSIGYDTSRIVGVDKYTLQKSKFFPEFSNTPGVGSIWAPDYEKIVSLRPDAVFLYATVSRTATDEIERRLSGTVPGLTVLRFDGYQPDTYPDEIAAMSDLLDCKEKGGEFLDFYTRSVANVTKISSSIPGPDRVKVYFETWDDYKSASEGSGYQQKIGMAGGDNIFAGEQAEYPVIDPEAVLARAPQVVVKLVGSGGYTFGGYNGGNETGYELLYSDLLSRKGGDSLPAVRDGRVYLIHTDILGGPQYFIGVQYLAKWFYPDRFAGLDPEKVHEEYLVRFQGLQPLDPETQVFAYPEEA